MNLNRKSLAAWVALASALTLATACTNKQGETESPVFLTVDLTDQAGLTVIVPELAIPPPASAELPDRVQLLTVTVPPLS